MKPKNYQKLLDLIVSFANERDQGKLPGLLNKIWGSAFMLGFYFQTGKANEEIAVQNQTVILEKLNETAETGNLRANHHGNIYCSEETNNLTSMHFVGETRDTLFSLFAMIMFICGFKRVRKCPGCNKLFIVKKHIAQKVCSNKCRQRMFQAAKSDEEKETAKKKRNAAYFDKVVNGGSK